METILWIVLAAGVGFAAVLFKSNEEPAGTGPLKDISRTREEPDGEMPVARGSEAFGVGCLVQLFALPFPLIGGAIGATLLSGVMPEFGLVFGVSGFFAGVLLGGLFMLAILIVGSRLATFWRCSNCMNRLADKKVRLCPTCHQPLRPPKSIADAL